MKNFITFLAVISSTLSFADIDSNQTLEGQNKKSPYEGQESKVKGDSPFVNSGNLMENMNYENGINHIDSSEEWLGKSYEDEDLVTFSGDKTSLKKISNKDIAKSLSGKSNSALMFSYVYDTFDYKDQNGAFAKTFQNDDSASSFQMGYLSLGYRSRFWGERFKIYGQFNGSVSFNKGKGVFQSGDLSRATIKLWHIPLSYHLGMRIPLGRYVGFSFSGGPLISALLQNRNDREDGASDKDLRQVGFGYSAYASIDFSMTQFFPSYGVKLKNESDIYDMNVSLIFNSMSVSNFKSEDVEISGASFGIGVNFEYF